MITDLKDGDKSVTLTAKIDQTYPQNAYQGTKTVQNIIISDDTGKIKLTLWDKPEIPKEDTGKSIAIRNGYVKENTYQGKTSLNLQAGKYSYVVVDKEVGEPQVEMEEMRDAIEPEEVGSGDLEKANILGIMDEIIQYLNDRRKDISEM